MGTDGTLIGDARRFPLAWRAWFWALLLVNLVAPLAFLGHPEARVILACYVVSTVPIVTIHRRLGWVRLLGVGHAPWLLALPWLLARLASRSPEGPFAVWLTIVLVVDGLCLVLDSVDLVRYSAGDREPVV